MTIDIPYHKTLTLKHVVLDYNGTIAKDGVLIKEIEPLLFALDQHYRVHVITSDTFGTVKAQLSGFNILVKVLQSNNHTDEKSLYLDTLSAENCIAIGNGSNDMAMLQNAALGIALIGDEGCSTQTMLASDVVCTNIMDALELLLNPKRLVATLRR
jgi:soluble P-type ATPase